MTLIKEPSRPVLDQVLRYVSWVLPLIVCLIIAIIPSETYIVNLVTDDALYYPTVARSIVTGGGSSYDGITRTNGYQPLWCWLEALVAVLVGRFDPLTYLGFIKLFMSVVVLLALVVWQRLIERVTGSVCLSSVVVLLLGSYWWSIYTLYSGMETPLVILLMGLSLLLAHQLMRSHTLSLLSLGVVMAATFLSRLDTVFFLGALGLFVLIRLRRNIKMMMTWIAPMFLLPLPYLWWNLSNFGSIVPVSGIKKTVLKINPAVQWSIFASFWMGKLETLVRFLHPVGVATLLLAVAVGLYLGRHELRDQLRRLGMLWTVPIGALLHYVYASIFMREADIYWYQYSEYLTAFLLLASMIASLAAWLHARVKLALIQWLPFAAVLIGVLAVLTLYVPRKLPNQLSLETYRTAVWARNHIDASSELRFGMGDSGIFRFVSSFKTVSLNGLAGDRELLKLVRQGNWSGIIDRYEIDYIVTFHPTEEVSKIPSRYVVFQSDPFVYGGKPYRMLIVDSAHWSEH